MRRWVWISPGVLGMAGLIGVVVGALFLLARGGVLSRVMAAPAPAASPMPVPTVGQLLAVALRLVFEEAPCDGSGGSAPFAGG